MHENQTASLIVDAAFNVHNRLGPGLLESVYEVVMERELIQRGCRVKRQHSIDIVYDELKMPDAFRVDLIVNDSVMVELKSVEKVTPVHYKQLLTYLRLADKRLGLLVNFGEAFIKDGIKRVVNHLEE